MTDLPITRKDFLLLFPAILSSLTSPLSASHPVPNPRPKYRLYSWVTGVFFITEVGKYYYATGQIVGMVFNHPDYIAQNGWFYYVRWAWESHSGTFRAISNDTSSIEEEFLMPLAIGMQLIQARH